MVRTEPAARDFTGKCLPLFIITPTVDLYLSINTKPHRVDLMLKFFGEPQLTFQEAGSTARINNPTAAYSSIQLILLKSHFMHKRGFRIRTAKFHIESASPDDSIPE